MDITFYKNCLLNGKYQEVFSTKIKTGETKSTLEKYLDSLNKFSLNLPQTYYETNMELVIDYTWFESQGGLFISRNIYDYNYCKITETFGIALEPNLVRYCFIKYINVKNGCVYLELEEDVFSTYINSANSQTCQLIASRIAYYGRDINYKKIPIPYDGNNECLFSPFIEDTTCRVLVELQEYKLDNNLRSNERVSHLCVVELCSNSQGQGKKLFEKADLFTVFYHLFEYIGSVDPHLTHGHYNTEFYNLTTWFEIGNIYVLPVSFDISSFYNSSFVNDTIDFSRTDMCIADSNMTHPRLILQKLKTEKRFQINGLVYSGELENDYKLISFGSFSSQVPIQCNGTDIPFEILFAYDYMNIKIILNIMEKTVDITKDFRYNQHYSLISSAENAQRLIQLEMKDANLAKEYDKLYQQDFYYGFGAIKNALGIGNGIASENYISALSHSISIAENAKDAYFTEQIMDKVQLERTLNKIPRYAMTVGNFITDTNFVSYFTPFFKFTINEDNWEIVRDTIDNLGYVVFDYINSFNGIDFNLLFSPDNASVKFANYDYIKIQNPNVYGTFTNEIAFKLNNILSSGIKIWYDEQRRNDNIQ